MKNRFKFKFCSSLECTLLRWLKMQGCLSQSWSNTVTLPLSSRCLRLCMFWSNLDGSLGHGGACPVWVSRFVSPRWASTSFLHNNDLLHAALPLETVTKSGTYVSKLYLKIQAERVTIWSQKHFSEHDESAERMRECAREKRRMDLK